MKKTRSKTSFKGRALGASLLTVVIAVAGCGNNAPANSKKVRTDSRLAAADSQAAVADAQPENADLPSALDDYIKRPEPLYKWAKAKPTADRISELRLTSQKWQDKVWTHRVQVFRPERVEFPDTALVLVTGGSGSAQETFFGQMIANAIGATFVSLFNIPNQPLFDKNEDALIAHTFAKYLETGDENWPLLFPMTKSVVKVMDAVGEYSKQEWQKPITKFVITGASKRGWTTWLTGAVDKRVIGIIPMVYDNLNLPKQMPHQLETWGKYSEQIEDYTRLGLQQQLATPQGMKLSQMIDPYSYRERITMPKLIINGTNDRYWTLDSLTLYRNDLKGPTSVLYVPNAGHSLAGQEERVMGTTGAWFRRVAAGEDVPRVDLRAGKARAGGAQDFTITVTPAKEVVNVRLWVAHSATRDFRNAKWEDWGVTTQTMTFDKANANVPPAPAGMKYSAAFAEIEIEGKPLPLRLSSSVVIWSAPN